MNYSEWQPMETAPRDGTEILIYFNDGKLPSHMVGKCEDGHWYAGYSFTDGVWERTTYHWMPLPDPPAEENNA